MKYIEEGIKQTPVYANVEVLVVGGGPAGFAAAVNCGRLGLKTMLVERSGTIGGVATAGLMSHWTGQTEGPFYEELTSRAKVAGRDYQYTEEKTLRAEQIIDPEMTKLTMLEMLEEAEVDILLYTLSTGVIKTGNKVEGVFVEAKNGRMAILADLVIDATGDGDIAVFAGAEYTLGREKDQKMQPVTIMFKVAGVDPERAIFPGEFDDNIPTELGGIQDLGMKHLGGDIGHVLLYPGSIPGIVTVNMTNCLGVNGLDAAALTKAEITCRKQIPVIIDFLKTYVPGFEHCYCIATSSMIGVRETRHIKGLYTITEKDISEAVQFEDWIVTKAYFNFDVHGIETPGLDPTGAQGAFTQKKKYTIPIGCFIPEAIDGLLLAGRDISGTHMAHSNYRAMPICVNMGQGVAAVAKVCVVDQVQPREAEIAKIQDILTSQGVTL